MNLGLAPYFRRFELPWAQSEESERRLRAAEQALNRVRV